MTTEREPPGLASGQWLHFACLLVLLGSVGAAWVALGRPHAAAFWTAVAFPVVHQVFVWLAWRLELRSSFVSGTIGFRVYLLLFFALFLGRFVSLLVLAWVDRDSLGMGVPTRVIGTTLLALPALYTMHSVARYFGFVRAAGADHFEPRYREMPLVREGIFRFTANGMYTGGFLPFWAFAVGFDSRAALIVAAFSHAYIWVHFFATERPDMRFLYASPGNGAVS